MNSEREKIPVHIEVGDIINDTLMHAGIDQPCLLAICHEEGDNAGVHEVVLGITEASVELLTERLGDDYEIVSDYHPPQPFGD